MVALIYLYDIIVISPMFEEHLSLLMAVFIMLQNSGLTIKMEKWKFMRREIKYLVMKITQDGIKTDTSNTEAIEEAFP